MTPRRLALVATLGLAITALLLSIPAIRLLITLMDFGLDLGQALQTEAFSSIGAPLLIPALILAALTFGLWRRWRLAHAASILLLGAVIVSSLPGLSSPPDQASSSAGETLLVMALVIELGLLAASWRHFWRQPQDVGTSGVSDIEPA